MLKPLSAENTAQIIPFRSLPSDTMGLCPECGKQGNAILQVDRISYALCETDMVSWIASLNLASDWLLYASVEDGKKWYLNTQKLKQYPLVMPFFHATHARPAP